MLPVEISRASTACLFLVAAWGCGGDVNTFGAAASTSAGSGGGATSASVSAGTGGASVSATSSTSTSTSSSAGVGGSGGSTPMVTCPATPLDPGETQRTITFGGNEREYEVQVPASYDNTSAVPLVFDMHGYTSNKDDQQNLSGWAALAETHGFVVVRPNGSGILRSWNAGDTCCGQAQSDNLDDVGLMKAIVAEVSASLCIDPKRVYASGLSNGGAMSHRLACEAADVFAAVAPVAYPIAFDPFTKCQPSRPIAVWHSHGTNDLIVPYDGSFTAPSTPDSFAHWGTANGCTGEPAETYTNGGSSCAVYQNCNAGVEVGLCTINGGHLLYNNSDDVPVAQLAWDFFVKHPMP